MFNNLYNIDLNKLAWLIPYALRRQHQVDWVISLLKPAIDEHAAFRLYRTAKRYELSITPQVFSLQKLLNDKYDNTLRRIRIDDPVWQQPLYLYQDAELKDEYLYQESENKPLTLWTEAEAGAAPVTGVILIPAAVPFDETELRAYFDKFKLFGINYKIQIV